MARAVAVAAEAVPTPVRQPGVILPAIPAQQAQAPNRRPVSCRLGPGPGSASILVPPRSGQPGPISPAHAGPPHRNEPLPPTPLQQKPDGAAVLTGGRGVGWWGCNQRVPSGMDIYLPVAELPVNLFLVLGLGGGVGFLSGMFGVGGGFLMTPMLILLGIPAAVAVATQAPQILASSVSACWRSLRRKAVDLQMGWVLTAGGLVGSALGVALFTWLRRLGQIDLFVAVAYVLFLGTVGGPDAGREPGQPSPQPPSRGPAAPAAPAFLGAWLAAQDALPDLAALHQRLPAAAGGRLRRAARRHPGHRRRVRDGPGHDLHHRHADGRRRRHVAVPDLLRQRRHHLPARLRQPDGRHPAGAAA